MNFGVRCLIHFVFGCLEVRSIRNLYLLQSYQKHPAEQFPDLAFSNPNLTMIIEIWMDGLKIFVAA